MKTTLAPILLTLSLCVGQLAQAAPSVDDILDNHIKAIGGEQAFKKITTRHAKAKLDMPAMGFSATIEIYAKAPNKTYSVINIPGMGIIKEGYDGTTAWTQNPFTGTVEKQGEQLAMAKRQADFYRDIELKTRYKKWTPKPNVMVDDAEAYVLVGTTEDGTEETLYINTENHMIVQMANQVPTDDGAVTTKMRFSNYKEIDGIKMPFAVKMIEPSEGAFSLSISEVEHNVKIDDSMFAKPAN